MVIDKMKRFHIALVVHDLEKTVNDYNQRLGAEADVVVPGEYALWRTETLNFSVRVDLKDQPGTLRHVGWEDSSASAFTEEKDTNGLVWESFSAELQME